MSLRSWICGVLAIAVAGAVLVPAIAQARRRSRETECARNLAMLWKMAYNYSAQYGG